MHIVWQKKYNVNVLEIDEQYQNLVDVFNSLVRLVKRGGETSEITSQVDLVKTQIQDCFSIEEVYFQKLGFNDIGEYRQVHSACMLQLSAFRQNYDPQQPLINLAHIEGIASTLLAHIASSHTDFNTYMKENRLRTFMKAHA
jgi:hemerythrin-like metal-binding protein